MKKIPLPAYLLLGFTSSLFAQSSSTLSAQNDTLVYTDKRAVSLVGVSNFRDLGGYPTQDGHRVKWGHLYRSADISKLTDADLQTLADRHTAVVCDLRGPSEIKTNPDRLPTGATWYNMPAGSENPQASTVALLGNKSANRDSMMVSFYGRTDHLKDKYKPVFDQLVALPGDKALLFHCTAGKDRTGIGAALILSALGVSQATILNDCAATDQYWQGNRGEVVQTMVKAGMDEAGVKSMVQATPKYLRSTFDAINRKYGSVNAFLTNEMGLTPDTVAQLRLKYVD